MVDAILGPASGGKSFALDVTLVRPSEHAEEALLVPVAFPTISDYPIIDSVFIFAANNTHGVAIQWFSLDMLVNSALVGVKIHVDHYYDGQTASVI